MRAGNPGKIEALIDPRRKEAAHHQAGKCQAGVSKRKCRFYTDAFPWRNVKLKMLLSLNFPKAVHVNACADLSLKISLHPAD